MVVVVVVVVVLLVMVLLLFPFFSTLGGRPLKIATSQANPLSDFKLFSEFKQRPFRKSGANSKKPNDLMMRRWA